MTIKEYMFIYEVFSKLAEEMKAEEKAIKETYDNIEKQYEKDNIYKAIYKKRLQIESICYSIENMEV